MENSQLGNNQVSFLTSARLQTVLGRGSGRVVRYGVFGGTSSWRCNSSTNLRRARISNGNAGNSRRSMDLVRPDRCPTTLAEQTWPVCFMLSATERPWRSLRRVPRVSGTLGPDTIARRTSPESDPLFGFSLLERARRKNEAVAASRLTYHVTAYRSPESTETCPELCGRRAEVPPFCSISPGGIAVLSMSETALCMTTHPPPDRRAEKRARQVICAR